MPEPITREGSFTITKLADSAYGRLLGLDIQHGDKVSYDVKVERSHFRQTPKPSVWRHPIRWFRWNPFMGDTIVTALTVKGVYIEREPDA
jgi:hypothetical protein